MRRLNARAQRTRSSPSALRAPLTRRALGGGQSPLVTAALLICALHVSGCVTVDGKGYWAWSEPPSPAALRCSPAPPGSGSRIEVSVVDDQRRPFPQALVAFQTGKKVTENYVTGVDGRVAAGLAPGSWRISATLTGFRPGREMVDLATDQTCKLTFSLRLREPAS